MTDAHDTGRRAWVIAGFTTLAIGVLLVVALGVTATALPGCESCHSRDEAFATATAATSHAANNVSCASCHVDTGSLADRSKFAAYEVFGMWLPLLDPGKSDVGIVSDQRCLACHAGVNDGVVNVRGLRIAHVACAEDSRCVDCHSEVGHGEATNWPRTPAMNDCASCHQTRSAPLACETCHTGKVERTGSKAPEFTITHGPNWQQAHGMGQMSSCSLCHESTDCGRCHGPGVPHETEFIASHAETSLQEGATCTSCHQQQFCDSCHLTPMPHTAEFVTGHSDLVTADGQESCMRCHVVSDCDTCHVKHVHPGGAVGNIPRPSTGRD